MDPQVWWPQSGKIRLMSFERGCISRIGTDEVPNCMTILNPKPYINPTLDTNNSCMTVRSEPHIFSNSGVLVYQGHADLEYQQYPALERQLEIEPLPKGSSSLWSLLGCTVKGIRFRVYSHPQVYRIWLWVYSNKIPIYPILYLPQGDYIPQTLNHKP